MSEQGKSGGVHIHGVHIHGGHITVGGDKIQIFAPLVEAVRGGPPEAAQKVEALKSEAAKGKEANDGVMAKLVEGIVGLVPGAVGAVAGAFATPILGGIAGPATKYVLDKIKGQ